MSDREMKCMRKEAAHRRRRIIFNNDGSEWDYCREGTAQDVLRINTTGLEDSQVDSIFYGTVQLGFSLCHHRSKFVEWYDDPDGIVKRLHNQGTDLLQIMIDFCRQHNKEIFWSFRVNDEHDTWVPPGIAPWKKAHPEYLFGSRDNPPSQGPWSGFDYALESVRDRAFEVIQDVCQNYDIDGFELDFFRQLHCFRKHVWGERLDDQDRSIMTDHIRRLRTMADEVGKHRGRPMLLAVRVPDSVEFAWELGLDVKRWLAEDLIDVMPVGGYFWLQPWEKSVELGHKYDVPVYAALEGSRVSESEKSKTRRSDDAYRAHAATAFQAGADGIYVFNLNYMRDPSHMIWRQIGAPETLKGLDKIYHVSVMGTGHPSIDSYVPDGCRFLSLPRLCPDHPLNMTGGQLHTTTITVVDDLNTPSAEFTPQVLLNIRVTDLPKRNDLTVALNGQLLPPGPVTWNFKKKDEWLEYVVDPRLVKQGSNDLEITFMAGAYEDTVRCTVHDVHLRIEYGPNASRRRSLTMSRNRFLAYSQSTT